MSDVDTGLVIIIAVYFAVVFSLYADGIEKQLKRIADLLEKHGKQEQKP